MLGIILAEEALGHRDQEPSINGTDKMTIINKIYFTKNIQIVQNAQWTFYIP